jgi:hypothetical protein
MVTGIHDRKQNRVLALNNTLDFSWVRLHERKELGSITLACVVGVSRELIDEQGTLKVECRTGVLG